MKNLQVTARRRLDEKLGTFPPALATLPPGGWISAIRHALGMSARDVGLRMETSGQRASKLEHDEISGRIQLSSLRRAAEAMNCRLVYVFIPNEPLEEMVRRQARQKAADILAPVSHSMRLEEQGISDYARMEQIDDLADELIDRRGLWSPTLP